MKFQKYKYNYETFKSFQKGKEVTCKGIGISMALKKAQKEIWIAKSMRKS